jgi:hypothetical protein
LIAIAGILDAGGLLGLWLSSMAISSNLDCLELAKVLCRDVLVLSQNTVFGRLPFWILRVEDARMH